MSKKTLARRIEVSLVRARLGWEKRLEGYDMR
jgi:hypothetical protein